MTDLAIFDFEDKSVRSVVVDGDPWFVGKDVCQCLDLADHHQALARLGDDERLGGYNIPTQSERGGRTATVISEPGVYRLVFTSRTDVAERFKRWLAHDVLPALRRNGRYEMARAGKCITATLTSAELLDLRQAMASLREYRMTFGGRAARQLARRLPIPMPDSDLGTGEDHVEAFAGDAIVREIGERLSAADLYAAYVAWCGDRGREAISQCSFGRRMREMGLTRAKSGGRMAYVDVALASPDADDDQAEQ